MKEINAKFYSDKFKQPSASNVSELIEVLKGLPSDLPVSQDARHGVELVVYNVMEKPFLEIGINEDIYHEDI